MKCKACKREIPDGSIFCLHCGERVAKVKTKKVSIPKPERLADGSFSARIMVNGIRYRVTCKTLKEYEAQMRAIKTGIITLSNPKYMKLGDAIDSFISSHDKVFSPSTVMVYKSIRRSRFQDCMDWNIYEKHNWQAVINKEASRLPANSLRHGWSIVRRALRFHNAPVPDVNLPRAVKPERPWLDYNQIRIFLDAVKGHDCELAALLALHSMRRSELMGMTPADVDLKDNVLHVRGAMVYGERHRPVYKALNKTEKSNRDIPILIPRLREVLTPEVMSREYLVSAHGTSPRIEINSICQAAGLPLVGLHGLRHSFASLAYHLGWKKLSVMAIGGWSSSRVVDEIYTHNADLNADIQTMKRYFETPKT